MDFTVIDLQSNRSVTADDGDEVILYIRPGGQKSVVVKYNTPSPSYTLGSQTPFTPVWFARWESGGPIVSSFTPIDPRLADTVTTSGPVDTVQSDVIAFMVDTTIPAGFMGINRVSVVGHVALDVIKRVTVKLVILPFDSWLDISWMPPELVDIEWELHSDNAWSEGLAERWGINANSQATYSVLRAGADVPFAIIPMIGGVPLTGAADLTALSFALRLANNYDSDPLLTVAAVPSAGFIVRSGSSPHFYFALKVTLDSDAIKAALADLNALAATILAPPDPSLLYKLPVFAQFTLTNAAGNTYVTKGIPFYLEQPAAALA